MENPPKARGPGRSGPRRRTGCLTCRARKVRCDETRPTCANCTRLRLQCAYRSIIVSGISAKPERARSASTSTTFEADVDVDVEGSPRATVRSDERAQQNVQHLTSQHGMLPSLSPEGQGQGQGQGQTPDFHIPFDMLGFIGEMTSDFQQRHLDLTNGGVVVPSPTAIGEGLFHDERQMIWGPGDIGMIPELESPRRSAGGELWETQLLEHFRESEPPPTIFGPVDLEWRYARDLILAQSGGCRALLLAVYCYADIHKAWIEGTQWKTGPSYHAQASSEIQSCLLGEVSEAVLKRVFASVLLLMLAELISPDNWRPATPFLHTSYLLLQRFHPRTLSWTGIAHLVVSWISLLDIKALVAGRDGDPLAELGNLTLLPKPTITPNLALNPEDPDETPTDPTYLITTSITTPAFTFFLNAQQLTRRIIVIDLHHRTRGTVSDEFEVLQIAHTVSADLETLWNRRPKILDLYSSFEEGALLESLSPKLAASIVRTFRSYVANFLALFVYLHRVAFAIYPRTDRVYAAVGQIIHLAKEESGRFGLGGENEPGTGTGTGPTIPVSFVWPLFIAALEGSIEQREWIVSEMQRMAALGPSGPASASSASSSSSIATPSSVIGSGSGRGRHPNASKALLLLEEMTRRQDASRTWADSRCVRRELFADFFVMI